MSRVLVISPHPDDESIGCGGTLRRHVLDGDAVRVIFLTSGEGGGHGTSPAEMAAIREREAVRAAEILGLERVDFWKEPDGALRATERMATRLSQALADWQPDLVYVTHAREMHPDHRAAARLVRRALSRDGSGPRPLVRQYEVWTPLAQIDDIVDISAQIDVKLAAIRAHESQCDVLRFDEAAQSLSRYRGEMHSWPGGDYAEVFQRMQ